MSKSLSDSELIRQAIERKQESGDYESLIRQVENRQRMVQLNLPQMAAYMSMAKVLMLVWGRGTGKTTILGAKLKQRVESMPRSTGLFVGPSYKLILTRILPSLIHGLEMFGLYENLHYFIGRQPPRAWRSSWGQAYERPRDVTRYITFWNGAGIHLVSQDVPGDGRGLNSDWIVADEMLLMSPDKLEENTDPTLRGTNTREFLNAPGFGSKTYMTSMPLSQEGMFVLDYEEKAMQNPKGTNFIMADCRSNLHNLRPGYLKEAKENALAEWIFNAEYLNVRPRLVRDGFYPLLNADVHGYESYNYDFYTKVGQSSDCRGDRDLTPGIPLALGVDWGAAINCMSVNQHLIPANEFRTLKSMYVLGDQQQVQEDLFNQFHDYYQYHDCKEVDLWCDHSGNHHTGVTKYTRAQMAQRQLEGKGWTVRLRTIGGSNPRHEAKHVLWNNILAEKDSRYPRYRINRSNCRELWISMTFARARAGSRGEIKKDKSVERSKKIARQHATDLSDANDTPIFGLFAKLLKQNNSSTAGLMGVRGNR